MKNLFDSLAVSRSFFESFGGPGLFAVAFLEFFLLPIPPDFVLIPLTAANSDLAILYVVLATSGSVFAGLIGYGIGRNGGRPALNSRFAGQRADRIEGYFCQYGSVVVAIGAFTPIPEGYELISIGSGVFGLDPRTYFVASVIGRGGRYSIEALLVLLFGDVIRTATENEIYLIVGGIALIIMVAYFLRIRLQSSHL
ncbi:VTT domain-containing protein [Haladaptatus sp. DYF46]|uniref:YqaA family protein n=1 Tax=Haladaptatus sp. DYF46 TaxID=2886041 RepID=UPI001E6349C3|nr:VTT domain-containing protein [Haladaptatus sp. DYF46]